MSTAKRIAIDARTVNDRYHGIGRFAFRLLEGLASAAPEREFVVFKGQGRDSRFDWRNLEQQSNVEFQDGPWPLYQPQEQLAWPWILRKTRADLFFSPNFPAPFFGSLPQVITVHDLIFDRYPAYFPFKWGLPYYKMLMRLSSRRARAVAVVSQATGADLAHYYPIPRSKIAVIPEGVDPHFTHSRDEAQFQRLRERYHLPELFILIVGTRRPHKNLARMVEAFASLGPDLPYQLVFAGPADNRFPDEALQAVGKSGLNGRVRFLDWVSERDLPGLYSMATVLALPSIIEGFGLPALEAMACGTPVLAANSSSLPEVVGPAGILVDPYDIPAMASSLRRMLEDEGLRHRLASAGIERASSFTWESTARKVLALFDEVVH